MSTENPQRITFWHCHIRTGPYAARHVARRRSHLCCAPWHYPHPPSCGWLATKGFWRHNYIELPLLLTSALHPSIHQRSGRTVRVRCRKIWAEAEDGNIHDHLAAGGAGPGQGPSVHLPPGILLRHRLQRWEEDQDRQALRSETETFFRIQTSECFADYCWVGFSGWICVVYPFSFSFFLSLQGLEVACQSILMHLAGRARSGLVPSS